MFKQAVPVWINAGSEEEKINCHLIFRERLPSLKDVTLTITAADFYRLWINGQFVAFGPARTALGYARVDEYNLSPYDRSDASAVDSDDPFAGIASHTESIGPNAEALPSSHEILLEVAGYHCHSYASVFQDSFLIAELSKGEALLKYTGRDFEAFANARRVRKTERFSVQRHFTEVWDERIENPFAPEYAVETVPVARDIRLIPRSVPYPACECIDLTEYISRGTFIPGEESILSEKERNAYSFSTQKNPSWEHFSPKEISVKPYRYVKSLIANPVNAWANGKDTGERFCFMETKSPMKQENPTCPVSSTGYPLPVTIHAGEWAMVDLGLDYAGFLRWSGTAHEETDLIVAFTELCDPHKFSFVKNDMQTVIEYFLPAGKELQAESFEPYSFRQIAFFVKSGSLTLYSAGLRTFERDTKAAIPHRFRNEELNVIYRAALRTFAHNSVDLFTDCPSRERAGWLCDSFFSGRAEYFFYGETPIEDAYLENYVLYRNRGEYPKGVLPKCYPSDAEDTKTFIPQWNLWYILEVCEYLNLRRPDKDRKIFCSTVFGVLDYLSGFENELGLLERLPSWNFIEWSTANTWTKDINYPTNMLYAGALEAASHTFDRPDLKKKAQLIRRTVVEMSFDGEVFIDNALRNEDGTFTNTKNVSEANQYYAVLFGGIDLEDRKYYPLKRLIIDDFNHFAPGDRIFCPKNAFIGLYLRMNVLMNLGNGKLLYENLIAFFSDMSRETGTLWEYRERKESLDHGFASYVALTLPLADEAVFGR